MMNHDGQTVDPAAADRSADARAILMIITVAVIAAVYFVSGWVPGI